MNIKSCQYINAQKIPYFKSAMVNINTISDTHGNIELANSAIEEIRQRKEDIFIKEQPGKRNIFTICGDWFIDGSQKGFFSAPEKNKGLFQLDIFNAFISEIKNIAQSNITLFTPGNHEFDGGIPLLDKILSSLDAKTIITNLHIPTSNGLSQSIANGKIINQEIIEIEDDKNKELKHKLLFLGISPVNLQYYQKNLNGISLIDNSNLPQLKVEEEHYQATLSECKDRIETFKEENPNGFVVLLCHTGVGFADNLAKRAKVDLIFDGHEHKENIRTVNNTPIIAMSQNFKKIVNTKIKFSDTGKLESIDINSFNGRKNTKKGPLSKLYSSLFHKDLEKQYSIKTNINGIKKLSTDGIRTGNNFLANFVTDSILDEIKKHNKNVDFFALNASAIRGSLNISEKPEISHFDVMNVLSGIREEEAQIMTTEVFGSDILHMVLDNIVFNSLMPNQNPLMQYSGLSINKTGILDSYGLGTDPQALCSFIIDTNTNKPIVLDKKYVIANTEKYFNKCQNKHIKKLKSKSEYLGVTVQNLFEKHMNSNQNNLTAKCDIRYK